MQASTVARLHALGRVALGTGLTVAPGFVAGAWVGAPADRAPGQVLAAALGARDAAIGLGALRAIGRGCGARPWLRAGIVADAADLVLSVRARDELPPGSALVVAAVAGGSVLVGAWLHGAVD